MKLYKFRSLAGSTDCKSKAGDKSDYCRVIDIIKEGKFWCSSFWELNDPMEGIFFHANRNSIEELYKEKEKYKICSFSGFNGFINPLLWGYYANGFRGIAIEIEIGNIKENGYSQIPDCEKVYQVKYIPTISSVSHSNDVIKILTRKLNIWKHEDEFRFLTTDNPNFQKIGNITNVFFGNPYGNVTNRDEFANKDIIEDYNSKKEKLQDLLETKNIGYKDVKIYGNGIYVDV